MNAITMLKRQHREVAELFKHLHKARNAKERRQIFEMIADDLAVHAAIEEQHFYPSVKKRATEEILRTSVEEHLQVKRLIADLLALDASDDTYLAKVRVLEDDVDRHVEEEEDELFPAVRKLLSEDELVDLAEAMQETEGELKGGGSPREAVLAETSKAAEI
jgi:hemerythrin superfamily protein